MCTAENNDRITNQIMQIEESRLQYLRKLYPLSELMINSLEYYQNTASDLTRNDNAAGTLLLLHSGEGRIAYTHATYTLTGGSFIFIPPATPYRISQAQNLKLYRLCFSGKLCQFLATKTSTSFCKPTFTPELHTLEEKLNQILQQLGQRQDSEALTYNSMLLWSILAELLFNTAISGTDSAPNPIESTIIFMEKNLNLDLTLEELATKAGYSPSHFSAIFKEETGESPITFFINLKMQLACEYLKQTSKSVKEISYILGYSNQYYFSRLFKTHIGLSPSDYRVQFS